MKLKNLFDEAKECKGDCGIESRPRYAEEFLEGLAMRGRGIYKPAKTADELQDAINTILNFIGDFNVNFTNTSVAIDKENRSQHSDKIYYSLFAPSHKQRWVGNLKSYRFGANPNYDPKDPTKGSKNVVLDRLGNPAFNAQGIFNDTTWSFWSPHVDGNQTKEGGAASQLPATKVNVTRPNIWPTTDRRLFTYIDASSGRFDDHKNTSPVGNAKTLKRIDDKKNQLPPMAFNARNDAERKEILDYIFYNSNGSITGRTNSTAKLEKNFKDLQSPIHSMPKLVTYGKAYEQKSIVMGTNEGFVHIFNAATGVEQSAFMPLEFLAKARDFKENRNVTPNNPKIYGFDNPATIWHNDVNGDGYVLDANGNAQAGETVYAYATMRRGGKGIYALDITDPTTPKLAWKIESGDKGFELLGQTWSEPVKTKIKFNGQNLDVLLFGGGYDVENDALNKEDSKRPKSNKEGNAIYMVNAKTGELIWSAGRNDGRTKISHTFAANKMNYSIPARIRTISKIDANGNVTNKGFTSQFFVGDVGGQIWRFFINENATSYSYLVKAYGDDKSGVFAELAGTEAVEARKFYHEPDVATTKINGKHVLVLNIGSGYRAHPLNKIIEDRFYSLRTTKINEVETGKTLTEKELYDATDNLIHTGNDVEKTTAEANFASGDKGWYIKMGVGKSVNDGKGMKAAKAAGEKILGTPLTVDGKIYFGTYEPSINLNDGSCEPKIGTNRYYGVHLKDATSAMTNKTSTIHEDRWVGGYDDPRLNDGPPGLPPSPVLICHGDGTDCDVIMGPGMNGTQNISNARPPNGLMYWNDDRK